MDFPGENDLSRIRVGLQFSDTFRVNNSIKYKF